ncbi:Lipase 2 [Luteitalea pratensis]|uniref:Lipase 2 n=1 Tax=Luteitalea pratensis TaxID=1855912 RepID=A0A143PKP9_LUTPR|nr:alpha/beta hydrolase [Luteitalea pratensis]AMY09117.1 Lipase 2 [Luteitalea pratensis]
MKRRHALPLVVLLTIVSAALLTTVGRARAQPSVDSPPARVIKDLVYATVDDKPLALDLYLPAGDAPLAGPSRGEGGRTLLVWVHGGAWNTGSKAGVPSQLVRSGLAVASVDFRQASEARFPAQVHDIKAAIRFLRATTGTYGYRADRIVIAGASSGGHLAALVGVTNGHRQLEGSIGTFLDQSSNVQAIVSYFGASNLRTILAQSTPFGLNMRRPALDRLLGGQPDQVPDLAELASPVAHVDASDPPLLLLHGDQDPQMPINQSHELQGAYARVGQRVVLHVLHGVAHGGEAFFAPHYMNALLDFVEDDRKD